MIRVDGISLPGSSPLGPVTIGGGPEWHLAEFDLIVILGPNGSGKTRLTESLTAKTKEHLQRLHLMGSPQAIDDPTTDIAPLLVSRSSTDLMGAFQSMSEALTMASGLARTRAERVLLERVAKNLDDQLPQLEGRSRELADALKGYERLESQAIAKLGNEPLDLSTYDAIGKKVAHLADTTWKSPFAVDDAAMRGCEEAVRPTNRTLAGKVEFQQAWQTLRGQAIGPEMAERLHHICSEVDSACNQARRMLEGPAEEISIERLPDRCRTDADKAEISANQRKQQAEALNALLSLRDRAREILDSDPERSTCLVCDQPIARDRLLQDLSSTGASGDDVRPLRSQEEDLQRQAARLRKAATDLQEALKGKSDETNRVRKMLESLFDDAQEVKASLGRISGASEEVAQSITESGEPLDQLLQRLTEAKERPAAENLDACGKSLQELLKLVERKERSLKSRLDELNRNLGDAEREFGKLESIRRALTEAKRVNAMDWRPDWEQSEARTRAESALSTWKSAIKSMIDSRKNQEDRVNREVVDNPEVHRRFRQLLDRVPHPLVRTLLLEEERVTDGRSVVFGRNATGKGTTSQLSEGYQVMVNLAAFIAIAGHVRPGQEHKAGWVLLDEPTNGLDPENRNLVAEFLGSLDREAMPRQMFITTFEREFADLLIKAVRSVRSPLLLIELAPWSGPPMRTPTFKRFD